MATAVMAAANAMKRIRRLVLRLIKYANGPSDGHKKNDPSKTLEALERWSGRATLLILAGILVDIGFLWLSPHNVSERLWGTLANALIGVGLMVEYIIIGRAIVASGEADRQSKESVAAAEERARKAQRETERLRAENLAMQAGLRPRHIPTGSSKPRPEEFKDVAKCAGTVALIQSVPGDFEAQTLAQDIFLVLSDLGWKPTILSAESAWLVDPRMIGEGIHVTTVEEGVPIIGASYSPAKSDAGRAAEALVAMLKQCLSQSQRSPPFSAYWLPEYTEMPFLFHGRPPPTKDAVIVLVGMRPLTFSLPPFSTPKLPV